MQSNLLYCKVIVLTVHSLLTVVVTFILYPSPPIDSISAVMIVWRLRGKIIRTTACCVLYDSCAHSYAHKCEQFLNFYAI